MLNWKRKYEILIDEIAKAPMFTYPSVLVSGYEELLGKCKEADDPTSTCNLRLPNNASEEEYEEFCNYLCDITNTDLKRRFTSVGVEEKEKEDASKLFDVDLTEKESK